MINIEIQFNNKYDMIPRSLYYWSRIVNLRAGDSYRELKPTIMINILNFNMLQKETNHFHTSFHIREDQQKFCLTNLFEIHFIEMPKLLNYWRKDLLRPRDDVLARWLLLLGTVDQKEKAVYEDILRELEVISMKDDILKEAMEDWEKISIAEEKRLEYEARFKEVMDEQAFLREMELREQEASEKGKKKGIERGIQQGKVNEKRRTIQKMLEKRMEVSVISEITEVTEEEILEIKKGI